MDKQINDFNELRSKAANYLEHKLFYAASTVDDHRSCWRQVRNFMSLNGFLRYDQDVGKQFLNHRFKDRDISKLSFSERHFYKSVKMLTDFHETGQINIPPLPHKNPIVFSGPVGEIINDFIDYKRTEERLSIIRIHCYQRNLKLFLNFCNKKGINSIREINLEFILRFIYEMDCSKKSPVYITISALRGFMNYAFENKFLDTDYSVKIPKHKTVIQPKLPSTYSKEEIEKLINSVDRSSAMGKRNYAIILIAARLGLRASDICNLKFDSLHWETSTIEIKQYKTDKELVLPLFPDIGNAIIDYLKYGRKKLDEPYVFLTGKPPYGHFSTSNVITHVVQRAFIKAGISIKNKRFGSHSLRHSLGFRMLEESTALPVITEVLGHESTESTRYYLRIDLKSMRQCMLDVPPVPTDFYEQKVGAFYE
jgi:site-specific recombinase XerD